MVKKGRSCVSLFQRLSSAMTAGALPCSLSDTTMLPKTVSRDVAPSASAQRYASSSRAISASRSGSEAVPHEPVQGVGRSNGEISLMSRGSADLIGSPIAYTCGSPLF